MQTHPAIKAIIADLKKAGYEQAGADTYPVKIPVVAEVDPKTRKVTKPSTTRTITITDVWCEPADLEGTFNASEVFIKSGLKHRSAHKAGTRLIFRDVKVPEEKKEKPAATTAPKPAQDPKDAPAK